MKSRFSMQGSTDSLNFGKRETITKIKEVDDHSRENNLNIS